jgi:hypothetical protein
MVHSPDGYLNFNNPTQHNLMTHDDRVVLIQGLNDRLLYLDRKELDQFLAYMDALYEVYSVPRPVYYGRDIMVGYVLNEERVWHIVSVICFYY